MNGKPWDEVRNQTERGKQKTNMERRCLLGKRAPAFEKTKTKQMQRCNLPRFKTNRRTRGSGNHAIPYFEGFTTAAVCQNQSGRSPFRGTKTNGTLIAALQKPEGGLRHTEGRQIADFGAETIFYAKNGNRAVRGLRGHEGSGYADRYFILWNFAVR